MLPLKGAAYVGGYTRHMWVTQHMPHTHTNTPILTTCVFCICMRSVKHTHSVDAFRQTAGMQCGDRRRPVTSDLWPSA